MKTFHLKRSRALCTVPLLQHFHAVRPVVPAGSDGRPTMFFFPPPHSVPVGGPQISTGNPREKNDRQDRKVTDCNCLLREIVGRSLRLHHNTGAPRPAPRGRDKHRRAALTSAGDAGPFTAAQHRTQVLRTEDSEMKTTIQRRCSRREQLGLMRLPFTARKDALE